MAQIDLSRYNPQQPTMGRTRQEFAGEGDVNAYKALASLGGTLASVATDFHNKEMDIFTDNESLKGLEQLKMDTANAQAFAMQNIDENNLVKGTDKTYDQYVADFVDQRKLEISDTLTEPISQTKFASSSTPYATETKVAAVFKNSSIVTERIKQNFDTSVSRNTDKILYDNVDSVKALDESLMGMRDQVDLVRKSSGESLALAVTRDMNKSFYSSAMESSLRRMETDPTAVADFSRLTGLGLMFKDFGDFSKYVTQQYVDIYGEQPEDLDMTFLEQVFTDTDALGNNALLAEPHPLSSTQSPEEKKQYLNRALSILFRHKQNEDNDFALKTKNHINHPSTKEYKAGGTAAEIEYIKSFRDLLINAPKSVSLFKKAEVVEQAATTLMLTNAERELISTGSKGYTTSIEDKKRMTNQFIGEVLSAVATPEEIKQLYKENPTLGSANTKAMQDRLLDLQRKTLLKMQDSPDSLIKQEREYYNLSSRAITIAKTGELVIDQKSLTALDRYRKDRLNRMGTITSRMESRNVLPDSQMNAIMDRLQVMSPDQQRGFFEQVNASSPSISSSLYTQAVKENKMDLETAALVSNAQLGDSSVAKFQIDRLLAIKNKYTGKPEKELIEQFKSEGWMGSDVDIKDLNDAVVSAANESSYIKDLKEVARSSGLTDTAIQAMFSTKNLQLITMDYLSRNHDEDTNLVFSTFGGRVKEAFGKAVQEFYGSRVVPVNGKALKGMLDPKKVFDAGNTNKITATAEQVTSKIYDELENGTLKLELGNLNTSPLGRKYKQLSPEMQQKMIIRDIKRDGSLSFNAIDTTGKAGELVLMLKDSNTGGFYRVKMLDSKNQPVTPVINGVETFETDSAEKILNDNFGKLRHTKQLRSANPAPISKRKAK